MVKAQTNTIVLPKESEFAGVDLVCRVCGTRNIFWLCFVQSLAQGSYYVCCTQCLNSAEASLLKLDVPNHLMLVSEDRLLEWFVHSPTPEAQKGYLATKPADMELLEEAWSRGQNVTVLDIPQMRADSELPKAKPVYDNVEDYVHIWSSLVQADREYERMKAEQQIIRNLTVRFEEQNGRVIASFKCHPPTGMTTWTVGNDLLFKTDNVECQGTIVRVSLDDQVVVTFERPVDLDGDISLSVKPVFNDVPFARCLHALGQLRHRDAVNRDVLDVLITGGWDPYSAEPEASGKKPRVSDTITGFKKPLNEYQMNAVAVAMKRPVTIVQGPPGTGKTTTIAGLVWNLRQNRAGRILVCAPTNVVVIHLTRYILQTRVNVVRLVSRALDEERSIVDVCTVNKMIYQSEDRRSKRLCELYEKNQKEVLSAREKSEMEKLRDELEHEIVSRSEVVVCTTSTAGAPILKDFDFKYVIVDEATQAVEPEIIIPLTHGHPKLVLVGDHQQLGPHVACQRALDAGLGRSLVQRLIECGMRPERLQLQYRMHPALCEFPSNYFYDGCLMNAIDHRDRQEARAVFPWPEPEIPMFMLNSDSARCKEEFHGTSYLNRGEALLVGEILAVFFNSGVSGNRIGVITPYAAQRSYLQDYLSAYGKLAPEFLDSVVIASVDAFQGGERDYIIVSCVRTSGRGFLSNKCRLNVTITRARMGLILIGSVSNLCHDDAWCDLIQHMHSKGVLVEGELHNLRPCPMLERSQPVKKGGKKRAKASEQSATPVAPVPDESDAWDWNSQGYFL